MPVSYGDASPIMQNLSGPESPRDWQGALPFTYHVGPGPVRLKMHVKMETPLKPIWDVVGTVRGTEFPDEWVIGGNHRDAWVYGAVDPNSGTAAMLEAVHGIGDHSAVFMRGAMVRSMFSQFGIDTSTRSAANSLRCPLSLSTVSVTCPS